MPKKERTRFTWKPESGMDSFRFSVILEGESITPRYYAIAVNVLDADRVSLRPNNKGWYFSKSIGHEFKYNDIDHEGVLGVFEWQGDYLLDEVQVELIRWAGEDLEVSPKAVMFSPLDDEAPGCQVWEMIREKETIFS
ncbi:hypothetical protein [Gulosibacter sediminis]|uniref:hypothetical protein n=1 Tax=Gulosibacter sediminis TaxID=1729695 RepID=UPI0024A9130A|nr:hypothetical protein [Gulosibacter sediminis]